MKEEIVSTDELCALLLELKKLQIKTKKKWENYQKELLKRFAAYETNTEGMQTEQTINFTIKINHKFKRTLDHIKYLDTSWVFQKDNALPPNAFMKTKYGIDLKKLRMCMQSYPEQSFDCITTFPTNPVITITPKE